MLNFSKRDASLVERMDEADADRDTLFRTYQRFELLNRLVAGWDRTYHHHIRPHLRDGVTHTLLDIGCGGADISAYLVRKARQDGFRLDATAIDPSPFVAAMMAHRHPPAGITYRQVYASDLVAEGARFDFVISNHLLHHLTEEQTSALASDCAMLANIRSIHSDLTRSRFSWILFTMLAKPLGFGTFIYEDGRMSIRKSYRRSELIGTLPPEWSVQHQFPWRLLAIRHERH